MLVGRGMRSHVPILDQLNIQDKILFVASNGDHTEGCPLVHSVLVNVKEDYWMIEAMPAHAGIFNPKQLPFEQWWHQRIMKSGGSELTSGLAETEES
jgi:hypothetical protein